MEGRSLERSLGLDLLKLVLAMMVVGIHVRFLGDVDAQVANLLCNGLFRVAVPLFLIINGYYFYSAVSKGVWREWLVRVVGLYCVWMIVYSPIWIDVGFSSRSMMKFGWQVAFGYHHLWYLPAMIGGAFVVLITSRLGSRWVLISCVVSFLAGVAIQYVGLLNLTENERVDWLLDQVWVHRNAIFLGYPFFAIGYLMARHQAIGLVPVSWVAGVALAGVALLVAEAEWAFRNFAGAPVDNLVSLGIICPAIFLLVKRIPLAGSTKVLALVASGVYFTHVLFIQALDTFGWMSSATRATVVFALSLGVAWLLVPVSRRYRYVL